MRVVSSSIWKRTSSSSSVRGRLGEPAALLGLGEQVEVGAQRGQRSAQLVAGVGDELALPVARGRERGEHRLNALRQPGDLVVALDVDRVELLGARDLLGGRGEPAYRAQAVAARPPSRRGPATITPRPPKRNSTRPSLSRVCSIGVQRLGEDQRARRSSGTWDGARRGKAPSSVSMVRQVQWSLAAGDLELGLAEQWRSPVRRGVAGLERAVGERPADVHVGGAGQPGRRASAGCPRSGRAPSRVGARS